MKDFFRNNGALILVIAVLLAAITAVSSYVLQGVPNPLANVLGVITTPIRNGISSFAGWAEGIYNYSFQYDELQAENARLRKEIAELEAKAREGEADSKENERLRTLLGLRQKRREFDFESATVTAWGSSNWASTLTLSKGAEQGVQAGNCVVDEAGNLVGIIEEAGANWSTMITITDATLEMGALIARTDSTAVLEGDFTLMAEGKLKLTDFSKDAQLRDGDQIITSNISSKFLPGILIGYATDVTIDPDHLTQSGYLIPIADFDNLQEVLIITDIKDTGEAAAQ